MAMEGQGLTRTVAVMATGVVVGMKPGVPHRLIAGVEVAEAHIEIGAGVRTEVNGLARGENGQTCLRLRMFQLYTREL